METKLRFKYDREADILHIDKWPPYALQESEELGDEVIARFNPDTGEIENLEVLFFSTRLLRDELLELPVEAQLRVANQGGV
jgi:hypothetical protein